MATQYYEGPQDDEEPAFDTGSDFANLAALCTKNP
jgi:hypothetical protein